MALYITTSRKPSVLTRRLVHWLVALLGAKSENRGKRSIAEIVERADALGISRVLLIGEDHGNPRKFAFLEGNEWRPSLILSGIIAPEDKPRLFKQVGGVATDATGSKILELLGVEPDANASLIASASSSSLSFSLDGRPVGPLVKILRLAGD
jgi:rRNA maturation protein Rpf1